jgi:ascorbate PTS system EIIB component
MKFLVVCGNGLGSSFIVEMNVKKVLKELGIEGEVSHKRIISLAHRKSWRY